MKEEFDDLWKKTPKRPGSLDLMDVEGFLSFNVALDDLFELEEGETEVKDANLVIAGDLAPADIFTKLASKADGFVGFGDLQRWSELNEILDDGDLLPSELQDFFSQIPKAPGTTDKLNKDGFVALWNAIDDLFEDEEESVSADDTMNPLKKEVSSVKTKLMQILHQMN